MQCAACSFSVTWSFSLPRRCKESIDDACLPDVLISLDRELACVAGENPGVVRQIVVEPKVRTLHVRQWQTIAHDRVSAKCLLHAEERLDAPNPAIQPTKGLRAIVRFE